MKLSTITTLALATAGNATAQSTCEASREATVRNACYELDLAAFLKLREAHHSKPNADLRYACLDWTQDGCSWAPDKPLGYDFEPSCIRHDFCYGNMKAMGKLDAERSRVDDIFHKDLLKVCPPGDERGFVGKASHKLLKAVDWAKGLFGRNVEDRGWVSCTDAADFYWANVRAWGG